MWINRLLAAATLGLLLTISSTAWCAGPVATNATVAKSSPAGFLVVPVRDADGRERLEPQPYYPQPGDILLYEYFDKLLDVAFKLVGSGSPNHAAIIIDRPDGRPAILEIGANSRPQAFTQAYIVEVKERLAEYPGAVMIRHPREPLNVEQREALRNWSLAQDGKKFAVGRLALQGSPFNCRHGLRHLLFANTYLDRDRWICSENVVAACTVAGLLNSKEHPANAMYPRDLCYDEKYNLSASYHPPMLWVADPNVRIEGDKVLRVMKEHAPVDPSQLPLVDMSTFYPNQQAHR